MEYRFVFGDYIRGTLLLITMVTFVGFMTLQDYTVLFNESEHWFRAMITVFTLYLFCRLPVTYSA